MARRYAEAGATVALLDRNISTLKEFFAVECDIADPEQAREAVERIAKQLGALHILVNNAAADTPKKPVADLALEDWQRHFAVNVTGAFLLAKHAIPHMRRAGGGVILNIASQLGSVTSPGGAAYSASKAALISLTRSIAVDHAADGIRAVSLSPGAIMTGRLTSRYGSEKAVSDALAGRHPIGRLGTPQEVAEAALFLAGSQASFFTGTDVVMDGGYTAV
ncbi:MAG: SDR family oxidoreductase [Candidatus Parcubacteria bacterium]|nr:SDR family oxidoreductase [Burkholderiales bacterium]